MLLILVAPTVTIAEPIKIGIPLALSGDLAECGTEMKNAIILANEIRGENNYELLFQDDQCSNKEAVSIARKFIDLDKIQYTLGFMCNQTLMATAPVYDRAGVYVFSGSGTSGDTHTLGNKNFRFFPPDVSGATRLYKYINGRQKSLAILTELSEYSVMMDRTFRKENEKFANAIAIQSYQFSPSDTDLRTLLLKIKSSSAEALYINADSDTSYLNILNRLSALNFSIPLYTVYLAGSSIAISSAPAINNRVIFSNLPKLNDIVSAKGKKLLEEYTKRYGESKCGFPILPTTFEAFRVLDLLISGKLKGEELGSGKKIEDGYLPPYFFDDGGNISGFEFEMQHIKDGKVETLER